MKLDTLKPLPIARDQYGRPMVPHPLPDGTPKWHFRPSSLGGIIEDKYNLQQWEKRMVAIGAAMRPDLLARVDSLDKDADRQEINRICDEMKEAAGSNARANIGTALHAYTEAHNRGEIVTPLPDYVADVEAYKQAIEAHGIGIRPELLERFVVWPDKRIAGSCDNYVEWGGRLVVMDLKTGKDNPLKYPMLSQAMQLAAYANASHFWDGTTAEAMPDVDTTTALICWLPAGEGHCELIEVDIGSGAHLVDLAIELWHERKRKDLGRGLTAGTAVPVVSSPEPAGGAGRPPVPRPLSTAKSARIGALRVRLSTLVADTGCTSADVKESWPNGAPSLKAPAAEHTADTLDRIEAMVLLLEMAHGIAEPDPLAVDTVIARLEALPVDLLAVIQLTAKALEPKIPNLRSGRATVGDLERLDVELVKVELRAAERLAQLVNHLSPLDEGEADAIVEWATEQREEPVTSAEVDDLIKLDDLEAERVMALAELHEAGVDDVLAALVDARGSKPIVLAEAKVYAQSHGLGKPRTSADVAKDRVLSALVLRA